MTNKETVQALPDAKESKGAKLEIACCRYVGKGVLKWND